MSSKRRIRRNQCGKKVRYREHLDAVAALSSLYRRTGYTGNVYKCPWCGYYHVGGRRQT